MPLTTQAKGGKEAHTWLISVMCFSYSSYSPVNKQLKKPSLPLVIILIAPVKKKTNNYLPYFSYSMSLNSVGYLKGCKRCNIPYVGTTFTRSHAKSLGPTRPAVRPFNPLGASSEEQHATPRARVLGRARTFL